MGWYGSIAGPHERPLTGTRFRWLRYSEAARQWPAAFAALRPSTDAPQIFE